MEDRDNSDAKPALEPYDQKDGQRPVKGTDEVLLTESNSRTESPKLVASELNGLEPSDLESSDLESSDLESSDLESSDLDTNDVDINQLIETHSRFLFGYAYRLAGSVSDSEDLTQQTFLIAYQKLDQLRTPAAARSWLCAILRSCWLKSIRRNRPTPASHFEFELSEIIVDENVETEIDNQAIRHAIHELPDDYKLVLLMYYFEELSYQEIAEKLQIKIGTVMSRLSRAKNRIRLRLHNKDDLLDQ